MLSKPRTNLQNKLKIQCIICRHLQLYTLKECRQNEESLRANAHSKSLFEKGYDLVLERY